MEYPWGSLRTGGGNTLPTHYTYTGQRDPDIGGLMYYNARWYDPVLGRFAQADTIVPEPGNPQALNRYSYVLNNPLKFVDSNGHFGLLATALLGGVIGATISYVPQVYTNLKNRMSFCDAALNVDVSQIIGGFFAGAVAGGTLGLATAPTVLTGLYTMIAGGFGGAFGE